VYVRDSLEQCTHGAEVSEPADDTGITKQCQKWAPLYVAQCPITGEYAKKTDNLLHWAAGFQIAAACVADASGISMEAASKRLGRSVATTTAAPCGCLL
jgi:hypothetical protein